MALLDSLNAVTGTACFMQTASSPRFYIRGLSIAIYHKNEGAHTLWYKFIRRWNARMPKMEATKYDERA